MDQLRVLLGSALVMASISGGVAQEEPQSPAREAQRAEPSKRRTVDRRTRGGMPVVSPASMDRRMVVQIDRHDMTMPVARFDCVEDASAKEREVPGPRSRPSPRVEPLRH